MLSSCCQQPPQGRTREGKLAEVIQSSCQQPTPAGTGPVAPGLQGPPSSTVHRSSHGVMCPHDRSISHKGQLSPCLDQVTQGDTLKKGVLTCLVGSHGAWRSSVGSSISTRSATGWFAGDAHADVRSWRPGSTPYCSTVGEGALAQKAADTTGTKPCSCLEAWAWCLPSNH
ncbi:hypothetical protein Tter_1565 [Thermobaculum terrenum ATCC BAA-798]|uniref:Uncharacterized protein n=1 Tax=Thermobaculum terrenum (strain ATCC BAA-798 / CCMEE 7001 / YNP1) TaxID=525904 RepID=D1CCF6_THET1|nr:hypothetical protein Tter_1565 [Thermobaculum terrenum ATCC BAA-798]